MLRLPDGRTVLRLEWDHRLIQVHRSRGGGSIRVFLDGHELTKEQPVSERDRTMLKAPHQGEGMTSDKVLVEATFQACDPEQAWWLVDQIGRIARGAKLGCAVGTSLTVETGEIAGENLARRVRELVDVFGRDAVLAAMGARFAAFGGLDETERSRSAGHVLTRYGAVGWGPRWVPAQYDGYGDLPPSLWLTVNEGSGPRVGIPLEAPQVRELAAGLVAWLDDQGTGR